jgi:hypothetical protein
MRFGFRSIAILATTATIAAVAAVFFWKTDTAVPGTPNELTFRLDSFALNLYPPTLSEINSRRIATLLNEPLVRMTSEGGLEPGIASSWTRSGNNWRFQIRTNARFSNGTPVTPTDVQKAICRSMQPSSSWGWALTSIKSTKAGSTVICDGLLIVGQQLEIRQTFNAPWLLEVLSGPAGWIIPEGATGGGRYGAVIGAGRYRLGEVVPDSYVLLEPVDTSAKLPDIRFLYVPDDVQAASLFNAGKLASLYLQSPALRRLVSASAHPSPQYALASQPFDRMRVLIVNEKSLAAKGFTPADIRAFRDALDASIDRQKLQAVSSGIATADALVLPIFGTMMRSVPEKVLIDHIPSAHLTVLTEPDAFSDLLATLLPESVGKVNLSHQTLEKGLLIDSIVKGHFDVVSIVIEGTLHSPKFWSAFFDPNGAFVVFGKPIAGIEAIDLAQRDATSRLQALLARDGNWISLLHERRIDAVRPWLAGMRHNPAGQDDLSLVTLRSGPSQ